MSLAVLRSRALCGMNALAVSVEVHLANGLPKLIIVGLPDTEVREAKDRVQAALLNAGFQVPQRRITVNLGPADVPKESGRFDLPIALGILAASGQLPSRHLDKFEYAGELSLSGELRPIQGALAMTFAMQRHRDSKQRGFIIPMANADEAALVGKVDIYPAQTLLQVCAHFSALDDSCRLHRHTAPAHSEAIAYRDFKDVKGQAGTKRALEIAAAGSHSVLLIGSPGSGKTMLASRLIGLLPPMSEDEALESAAVSSLAGAFKPSLWKMRPYRSPHHTTSGPALVGGGSVPRPGEISLAHFGVLFLDELPEFDRRVLEVLRQPMESGEVTIARTARHTTFPARFQLIAAMNPCPCGYLGHPSGKCHCSSDAVARYQSRISGPLLDRIDIQIEVAAMPASAISGAADGESSAVIAERVARAHQRQLERQGQSNQRLGTREIDQYCKPDADGARILQTAMTHLQWSARSYHRVLKVARTIADLAGSDGVTQIHVAEAIQYRRGLRAG